MEKNTDVKHVTTSINAHSQANEIARIDQHLKDNNGGIGSTVAEQYPIVRPVLSFLASAFPDNSPWGNAIRNLVVVADNEFGTDEEDAATTTTATKGKGRKK